VVAIVKAFQWGQGTVTRHLEEKNAGIFKMWVRRFPVAEPDTSDKKHIMMVGSGRYGVHVCMYVCSNVWFWG
jgi:hypothetical protein